MSTDVAVGVLHPRAAEAVEPRVSERLIAWLYGGTALAVVGLMGLAGLAMRFSQADLLGLSPSWFPTHYLTPPPTRRTRPQPLAYGRPIRLLDTRLYVHAPGEIVP